MEWFEDDGFWRDFAPVIFDDERWAEAEHVADALVRLLRLEQGQRLLDAGCGVGRIAVPLARRGIKVTGVDVSPSMLGAARESAASEGLDIEFVEGDIRGFGRAGEFDAAICVYTSFGYCAEKEGDLEILAAIARSLKPGGRLCLEFLGKEIAREGFVPEERYQSCGRVVHSEYGVVGDWEALAHRWVYFGPDGVKTCSWNQRLYSAEETRAALLYAGFAEVSIDGGFEGEPYGPGARTLAATARKA